MALTKEVAIDKIEVLENGTLQVRQITRIMEDGKELSSSYHRWAFSPGSDVSAQPTNVQAIARDLPVIIQMCLYLKSVLTCLREFKSGIWYYTKSTI